LPKSVATAIKRLSADGADFDTVGAVLANTPGVGVAMKGIAWKGTLWQATKSEFHSFLCTDSAVYADLRSEWDGLKKKGSTVVLTTVAAVVGAKVGVTGGVVVPLIAWLLASTVRVGKQAICATLTAPPAQTVHTPHPPAS
jgi:hypothetical protein